MYPNKEQQIRDCIRIDKSIVCGVKEKENRIGHVARGESLLQLILEGRMKWKRGRPRLGMISEPKESSYAEMKRIAEDRESLKRFVSRTCRLVQN
jgi:hypothetical protein